jgi:NADH-quinone oxidoreductase subunit L
METLAWLVLVLPLAGCVTIALTFRVLPERLAGVIGTGAIFSAFACAVGVLVNMQDKAQDARQSVFVAWDIANTAGVDAQLSILVDPLSVYMMLVVTGVSGLIHLYSTAYMESDRGYRRFFSYLNFFVFSMLVLVMAGNFLLLIIGWAFVGAASYLLISFWFRRQTATTAGIKAFVINVVGDIGLVLGTFFIFRGTGTLDLLGSFNEVQNAFSLNDPDLVAGCCLLLVGAFAKSAQIPFHTWLPDAMEGPTPVSALIHAATMVTAGVYLIARMHPLFEQAPDAANVGAIVGCATLFIAATIGLVMTDLKRVIAYSTMSQIGYMIMGVSAGAYSAGMFHLLTHAFFKALLFMGAGSVISAMANEQNLNKMGGFRKAMPFTYGCFIVGGLALSGVPPFSGWLSKDEILLGVGERGGWFWILYVFGYLAAFLTAIYTFRMIFRAFWGDPCEEAAELEQGHLHHAAKPFNPQTGEEEDTDVGFPGAEHHIAEREWPMKAAMSVLALGAFGLGALQIPGVTEVVHNFLEPSFQGSKYYNMPTDTTLETFGLVAGAIIGLAGVGLAYFIWVLRPGTSARLIERFRPVHTLLHNKWYFDELIDLVVVRPGAWIGRFGQQTFERVFVQGTLVGGTTGIVRAGSAAVRAIQDGFLRVYVALFVIGLVAVGLYFLLQS